jgi:hypothetical protein
METNIQRQPKEIIRTVSSGGAIVGPSEEAQFQIHLRKRVLIWEPKRIIS